MLSILHMSWPNSRMCWVLKSNGWKFCVSHDTRTFAALYLCTLLLSVAVPHISFFPPLTNHGLYLIVPPFVVAVGAVTNAWQSSALSALAFGRHLFSPLSVVSPDLALFGGMFLPTWRPSAPSGLACQSNSCVWIKKADHSTYCLHKIPTLFLDQLESVAAYSGLLCPPLSWASLFATTSA